MSAILPAAHQLADLLVAVVGYPAHAADGLDLPEPVALGRVEVCRRRKALMDQGVGLGPADRQARSSWAAEQIVHWLNGGRSANPGERNDEDGGPARIPLSVLPGPPADAEQPQQRGQPASDGPAVGG